MPFRILEAPSVQRAKAEEARVARGLRKESYPPFSGKVLGLTVTDGLVKVDEALTYGTRRGDTQQLVQEPLWHVFVRDLRFRDVTREHEPDAPDPVFPITFKPYQAEERARMQRMLRVRLAHDPMGLLEPSEPVGAKK